jgi:hypothetical protein
VSYWYHQTSKQYIIAIANLFSGIHVKRKESDGTEIKDIKVPLMYGTKRKMAHALQHNEHADSVGFIYPAMSFYITSLQYNGRRKLNTVNEIKVDDTHHTFEAVPYDYNFEVTVKTKYQNDLWQILEQILYYFKPDVSLDIIEAPNLNITRDVLIKMENLSIQTDEDLEATAESSRSFDATFDLLLQGAIYPPVKEDVIITDVHINTRDMKDLIPDGNEDKFFEAQSTWDGNEIIDRIIEDFD